MTGSLFVLVVFLLLSTLLFEELMKKVLAFLASLFFLFSVFESPSLCYLLLLIYIGGLFILMVFISSLHFISGFVGLKEQISFFLSFFLPLSCVLGPLSLDTVFWVFLELSVSTAGWFFILVSFVFVMVSLVFPSGKSVRNL